MTPAQQYMAKADAAKKWELASDNVVKESTARELSALPEAEAYLSKIAPETKITGLQHPEYAAEDLGFNHIIEALQTSLEGRAPKHLTLTPDDLANMSMAKAVQHTHDLRNWANREAMVNNPAVKTLKEYDDGMRLVEHAKPETPEGLDQLKAALEHEGSKRQMSNCLGDPKQCYVPDIASGAKRVLAIKDKLGNSHVNANLDKEDVWHIADRLLPTAEERQAFSALLGKTELGAIPKDELSAALAKQFGEEALVPGWHVREIVGGAHSKPKEEYWRYAQELAKMPEVKSFADPGAIGLTKTPAGYLTQEELAALAKPIEEFAEGGLVKSKSAWFDDFLAD